MVFAAAFVARGRTITTKDKAATATSHAPATQTDYVSTAVHILHIILHKYDADWLRVNGFTNSIRLRRRSLLVLSHLQNNATDESSFNYQSTLENAINISQ